MTVPQGVQTPGGQQARAIRVLVVDDTPALRVLMRAVLEGTGFDVVGEAGDGLSGVTLATELRPDLVLLDLAMPVMDGLEALPRLKAELPDCKVVIVSGFERRAMEAQVVEAGADAYVQKGLPPQAMLAVLESIFPGVQTDLAGRVPVPRRPEPPPAETDERIQHLEEDLEELLYVVSHDLSEPVHIIKGFAQRLARRVRTDEEGEFCEFIVEAADRMQQLLDDLLTYARAGRGELPQELLDCRRVVDSVVAGLTSTTTRNGARVTVGDLPRSLVASRLVVTQVLHNLLANALKFTRPGVPAQVRLDARDSGGHITFRVKDSGIGLDSDQSERIFQPFTRLNAREAYPGSGVGLAICKRLVERSNGRIWVESQADGTTFFVELPA
ncbi:MAG: response regulator [Actinomycetota bacterium]|nr:response regulator [Actinomycetota bacterium]